MRRSDLEILLNEKEGRLNINKFCYLQRYTRLYENDSLKCDKLILHFKNLNQVNFPGNYEIKARDYEGVKLEIANYTRKFFEEVTVRITRAIRSGNEI